MLYHRVPEKRYGLLRQSSSWHRAKDLEEAASAPYIRVVDAQSTRICELSRPVAINQ